MPPADPRSVALFILDRYRPRGSNLSHLIAQELKAQPEGFDRGLVRDLVWGAVRRLNTLDWLIDRCAKDPWKMQPAVRNILRLGVFQLLFFSEKVPAYAAVDESVKLARVARKPQAASFINGILRTLQRREKDLPWPDEKDPALSVAVRHAHPDWLVRRWIERWGIEETEKLCAADNIPPPLTIRANTLKVTREALKTALEKEGVPSRPCNYSPDGLILEIRPELEKLQSCRSGLFIVQDEASQLVTHICAPCPGEKVLDLCCGSGIKTSHLVQLSEGKAAVTGADTSERQLADAQGLFSSLGIEGVTLLKEDARTVQAEPADVVLIDAPCSGLGAVRRKPDIKWNRTPEEITERYPRLQGEILSHAASLVKKGGRLIYSTCTTEPEENEDVVRAFLSAHSGFTLEKITSPLIGRELLTDDGNYFRSFPHRNDMDGFFAARIHHNAD